MRTHSRQVKHLLDTIAGYWQAKGYTLQISDAVLLDIEGNTNPSSYGEKSIVELARTDVAAGNKVLVWGDDAFFTKSQNLQGYHVAFL